MAILVLPCSSEQPPLDIADGSARRSVTPQLDILFVLDTAPSMRAAKVTLGIGFSALLRALNDNAAAQPSVHIAVISSDVGIAPFEAECAGTGAANGAGGGWKADSCPPHCAIESSAPSYFVAGSDGSDRWRRDDEAALEAEFVRRVELTPMSCRVPQPLEAMRRAVRSHAPGERGFARPNAHLAVIFISARDDCSATNRAIFAEGTSRDERLSELGPFSVFRCTQFGVTCDGLPALPRADGSYRHCDVLGEAPYLLDPAKVAAELRVGRGAANRVLVAAIAGDPAPFRVSIAANGNAVLDPSCDSQDVSALPAVRLKAFTNAFGSSGRWFSLCRDDIAAAMKEIARGMAGMVGASVE